MASGWRPFVPFAMRDAALTAVTAGLWMADRAARRAGRSAPSLAMATGLATGVVGFFIHEWGHLAGTLLSGGTAQAPVSRASPFLFHFDVEQSSREQFLAMSWGGYLASAVGTAAILGLTPDSRSGRVARSFVAVGVVVTLLAEVPTTVRVARGGPMPSGGVYGPRP